MNSAQETQPLTLEIKDEKSLDKLIEIFGLDYVLKSVNHLSFTSLFNKYSDEIVKRYRKRWVLLLSNCTFYISDNLLDELFNDAKKLWSDTSSPNFKCFIQYLTNTNRQPTKTIRKVLDENKDWLISHLGSKETEHIYGVVKATLINSNGIYSIFASSRLKVGDNNVLLNCKKDEFLNLMSSFAPKSKHNLHYYHFQSREMFEMVAEKIRNENKKAIESQEWALYDMIGEKININVYLGLNHYKGEYEIVDIDFSDGMHEHVSFILKSKDDKIKIERKRADLPITKSEIIELIKNSNDY